MPAHADSPHASARRVAVVYGGRSSEHAISCVSAGSIISALRQCGYEVLPIGIDAEGRWSIQSGDPGDLQIEDGRLPQVSATSQVVNPTSAAASALPATMTLADVDVVFPVLHGPWGEDGTVQGLLELADIPYVGSGVLASAMAMDKAQFKRVMRAEGIQVAAYVHVTPRSWAADRAEVLDACEALGYPLFVKPCRTGSSIGVAKVRDRRSLQSAIVSAALHDPQVLVEASVEGAREIEVGVITDGDGAPMSSVPAEISIRSGHEFYDFEAKYLDDSVDLIVPAVLSSGDAATVRELACRVFQVLGCEGLARVDFLIGADGSIVVNEVNTMPGFTSISLFPRMWAASGMDYPQLVDHLVRDARRRGTGLR